MFLLLPQNYKASLYNAYEQNLKKKKQLSRMVNLE